MNNTTNPHETRNNDTLNLEQIKEVSENTTVAASTANNQVLPALMLDRDEGNGKKNKAEQIAVHREKQHDWRNRASLFFDKLDHHEYNKKEFIWNPTIIAVQSIEVLALQEELKLLQKEWYALFPEDAITIKLNKKYATIDWNGQFYILKEISNAKDFTLSSKQSFKDSFENTSITLPGGIIRTHAEIYLKHRNRRTFHGIEFDTTKPTYIKSGDEIYYNIWKGFTVLPEEIVDIQPFWDHIKNVICAGDDNIFEFMMDWLARLFQHPVQLSHGIVLIGKPGTGKNTFVDTIGRLLGNHYLPLDNMSQLTSNFNFHQKNAILIHANEAFWGGNKKDHGRIKAAITDPYFYIEPKGKDPIKVRNHRHLIISSNEDYPVHLDNDDRRFLVLKVSDKYKQSKEHFDPLYQLLEEAPHVYKIATLQSILHYLLKYEIKHMRSDLPRTSESFDLKMIGVNKSDTRYIYNVLITGGFSIGQDKDNPVWQPSIPKSMVFQDYVLWCNNSNEKPVTSSEFGKTISRLVQPTGVRPRTNGIPGPRCYEFDDLEKSRLIFSAAFETDPKKIFKD